MTAPDTAQPPVDLVAREDQPLPEDAVILAAHPMKTGAHDIYGEAHRMVSAKRSKGALVNLVNWLLARATEAEHQRDAALAEVKRLSPPSLTFDADDDLEAHRKKIRHAHQDWLRRVHPSLAEIVEGNHELMLAALADAAAVRAERDQMRQALEAAEALYHLGLLNAPAGLYERVQELRTAALAATSTEKGR